MSSSPKLASVQRAMKWTPRGPGVQLPSHSNEVWLFDDVVVRICWRGDRQRLTREAAVLRALANRIPCPEVVAEGRGQELSWMVTRRLPGTLLSVVWPHLSRSSRQAAVETLGHMLRTLHATELDSATRELLARREPSAETAPDAIVGADINPLPVARALRLVPAVRQLASVDMGLIDEAAALLARMVDPFAAGVEGSVVHGDVHLANVLWHEGSVVGLLDFEWVRLGPTDLELEALIRFGDQLAEEEAQLYHQDVPGWLRTGYPGLFAYPQLEQRLRLYELAYCLRHLLLWPPSSPVTALPWDHPYRRLARTLAGSSPSRAWVAPRCADS